MPAPATPPGSDEVIDAPEGLHTLVAMFASGVGPRHSRRLNETELRRFYLDPFFTLLGWDVDNSQRAQHEVRHEDRVRIGGRFKAPDYGFYLGHHRKFLVEAKKPSVDIHGDVSPAYQLRRYGWNAKVPLAILTDFEELAVYDCRVRPRPDDAPTVARLLYYRFDDLPARWGDLAALFGRDAVAGGAIERFAGERRRRTGILEVDAAFLLDLERWRDELARNVALRNKDLSLPELNEAVQKTLDRIIFLRICEDRGIEPFAQLQALLNGAKVYPRLADLFRRADARYNSGLFHFYSEKGRAEDEDGWMLGLEVDDGVLKGILRDLYPPRCPYDFAVMPADILGSVYERFLGKTIRLTPAHRAVVEDKPEVRKAGGVFYTPTPIVEAIVERTVGRALAGKAPADVDGSGGKPPLRIVDPACGSGSFLIGAYQYLLDWYRDAYVAAGPLRHKHEVYEVVGAPAAGQDSNGDGNGDDGVVDEIAESAGGLAREWRLTSAAKKRILLTHIFGVDIDRQAVEVTKLSLLLKVLEGETEESLDGGRRRLMQERALPDLGANIQCGNSLIGPAFYQSPDAQLSFADAATEDRINVFDWRSGFPAATRDGGFDVVIGNPPYVRIQTLKEWAPVEVEYYKRRYRSAGKGNYDVYVVFVERGLDLLNARGRLGYILPHKFFNAKYGEPLRALLAGGRHLAEVIHFGDQQVFAGATTYTCLMFLDKGGADHVDFAKVADLSAWQASGEATSGVIPAEKVTPAEWNFVVSRGAGLFERLREMPVKLGDVAERIFQGIKTGADPVFIVRCSERREDEFHVFSRAIGRTVSIESRLLHPLIKGGDSRSYCMAHTDRRIIFPYEVDSNLKINRLTDQELQDRYPQAYDYLSQCKSMLLVRDHGKARGYRWFEYSRNQALDVIHLPKLFTPDLATCASFSVDIAGHVLFTGGVAGGYGIVLKHGESHNFILALLNSTVLDWYVKQSSTQMRGGYYSFEARFIRHLPIRDGDNTTIAYVTRRGQIVTLVDRMLALHRELVAVRSAYDKSTIQRRISSTDDMINTLVYELYDLSDSERALIENQRVRL